MVSAFANYKSGVLNPISDERTASFNTFDATLRYAVDRHDRTWSSGWEFALSAQNLFDRSPLTLNASITNYLLPPYDATNYSAIGRFINVSVSKRW